MLTVLAVLPSSHPAAATSQELSAVQLNAKVLATGGTVTGTAWRHDDSPVPDAKLRLRDVATGKVMAWTHADGAGRFTFVRVLPGSYIVELVDERDKVLAVGKMFTIGRSETVVTVLRLGAALPRYGGFFSNAAAAALASAAALGLTALGAGGPPASARS